MVKFKSNYRQDSYAQNILKIKFNLSCRFVERKKKIPSPLTREQNFCHIFTITDSYGLISDVTSQRRLYYSLDKSKNKKKIAS